MANRKNTFLLKRSNVPNKIPNLVDLELGEIALNIADVKLYASYTGGLSGATEVRQIGWDRLSIISGGTVNGDVTIASNFTVTGTTNLNGNSFYNQNVSGTNPYEIVNVSYLSGYTFSGTTTKELFFGDEEFSVNSAGRSVLTSTSTGFISFAGVGGIDDAGVSFEIPLDYLDTPEFNILWTMDGSSSNQIRYVLNITTGNTITELDLHTTTSESIEIFDSGYTGTSWRILSTPYSSSTINYIPGTYIHVELERDPGNVGDTLNATAYVSGLRFKYNGIT